jgi:hypothetical protein
MRPKILSSYHAFSLPTNHDKLSDEKMPESQFKSIINALCERWHIPAYADYMSERYWPAFSRLDDAGQDAFWNVLGAREVDMPPRIAIFVRGVVVQEVASDTPDVPIKLLDMDSIEEGDPPDQWRPPDVVINNSQDFEAYTSGGQTP